MSVLPIKSASTIKFQGQKGMYTVIGIFAKKNQERKKSVSFIFNL
jgi:hypothetical protein